MSGLERAERRANDLSNLLIEHGIRVYSAKVQNVTEKTEGFE
jgi:hypothetical protein